MKARVPLALLTIAVAMLYFAVNRSLGSVHSLKSPLDDLIRLVPVFVIPYLLFELVLWLTFAFSFITGEGFEKFSWALIAVHLISFTIYLLYETSISRPAVTGAGLLPDLVRWLYAFDRPFNAFPSLHTSSAILLAAYYQPITGRYFWIVALFCALVVASTLLTKQHYLADVVGGSVVGFGVARALLSPVKTRVTPGSKLVKN